MVKWNPSIKNAHTHWMDSYTTTGDQKMRGRNNESPNAVQSIGDAIILITIIMVSFVCFIDYDRSVECIILRFIHSTLYLVGGKKLHWYCAFRRKNNNDNGRHDTKTPYKSWHLIIINIPNHTPHTITLTPRAHSVVSRIHWIRSDRFTPSQFIFC